jgi:hypothetical protein
MKKPGYFISRVFTSILSVLLISSNAFSWGFYAHKKINRMAAYGIPTPLSAFYKRNLDYITTHAVDPDKLKFID